MTRLRVERKSISVSEMKKFIIERCPNLAFGEDDMLYIKNSKMEDFLDDCFYSEKTQRICLGHIVKHFWDDKIVDSFMPANATKMSDAISLWHTTEKQKNINLNKIMRKIKSEVRIIHEKIMDESVRLVRRSQQIKVKL
jgi:hypothetical protein